MLSPDRKAALAEILQQRYALFQQNQLFLYEPVSPDSKKIHLSTTKQVFTTGGNRSSKSDTHLVELCIQLTGIVPRCLEDVYPREKIRLPIRARLVCKSLLNTWDAVLRPKLQWWQWNGRGNPGSDFGHWGWIPPAFLIDGEWAKSWNERHRTLTLVNGSTLQIMSYDQDLQDFSGGSYSLILEDEGPPQDIHRENLMRTLDVGGRVMIAMTPPDDESDSWDAAWVYDDLYLLGLPGPNKDRDVDTFNLFTEQNRTLAPEDIEIISRRLTPQQREVRLHGKFMHLGGRIYPNFSTSPRSWCFSCNSIAVGGGGRCSACGSELVEFNHVEEPFEIPRSWPTVFALDPHPRKPNCCLWVSFDQNDDPWVVAEMESNDPPATLWRQVEDLERNFRLNVSTRLIDPNMGRQSGGVNHREHSVQEEFDAVGLHCSEATDDRFTARSRIRDWLVPNPRTRAPRLHLFNRCRKTIFQFERYSWDSHSSRMESRRDVKQVPQDKHSDFPTLLGYIANGGFTFNRVGEIIQRMPTGARGLGNASPQSRRNADLPEFMRHDRRL